MSESGTTEAQAAAIEPCEFQVKAQDQAGPCLVSVSVAAPEVEEPAGWKIIGDDGREAAPQCRVLSRDQDGSQRTLLFRFPWELEPGRETSFRIEPRNERPDGSDLLTQKTPYFFSLAAGRRRLTLLGNHLSILLDGAAECGVEILAPDFPIRFMGPEITVVENGPCFAWVAVDYFGGSWNARLEVKVDCLGEIEMIARLRRVRGDAAFPRFGLRVYSSNAAVEIEGEPVPSGRRSFQGIADRAVRVLSPAGASIFRVPEGPQTAQGQAVISASRGETEVHFCRTGEAEPGQTSRILEGQERSLSLVLLSPDSVPGRPGRLTGIPAQRARPVVRSAEFPVDWGELAPLREQATRLALSLQCLEGDRYGEPLAKGGPAAPSSQPEPLSGLDAALMVLEDYYRGGDERLREWALRIAESYLDLRLYRGQDLNAYGGTRGRGRQEQELPSGCQAGASLLLVAYEETGDLRYREAATACLDRVVKQLEHASFLHTYSLEQGWRPGANVRSAGICQDLVALYRYTGSERYLDAARRILRGLSRLRAGEELWKEVYPDPCSLIEMAITGEDVGVLEDTANFESPFALQQVLLGAQAVFQETEDELARKIVVDISDWLVESQSRADLWNFPQAGSPAGSISRLGLFVSRALLRSYVLLGEPDYFQAAERTLRLVVQLFEKSGAFPEGLPPEEKPYFYSEDFTDVDFRRLRLSSGRTELGVVAGFLGALDEYLQVAFDPGQSLRQRIANPLASFLLNEAPAIDLPDGASPAEAGPGPSAEDEDYRKCLRVEASQSAPDAIEQWEQFVETYRDTPLEYLRLIRLAEKANDAPKAEAIIERFLREFPGHARGGWFRLRLAAIAESRGDRVRAAQILNEIAEDLYGSVWARDAAAVLYRLGESSRPDATAVARPVCDEHEAELVTAPFIDPATGMTDPQRTHFSVAYGADHLEVRVILLDRAFSGDEVVRIYLDPVHDYESWCSFEVGTNGERRFRELGWAKGTWTLLSQDDWSARVNAEEREWDVLVKIPLAKLGLTGPVKGKLLGLNLERESNLGRRLWQPMLSYPVMPQAFGRLLLL